MSQEGASLCDISDMQTPNDEPLLYRQLMAIKPEGWSPNQWLVESGVNRSFFTDLKKRGNANWSTIEKLVEAAGMTLAQFQALDAPEVDPESRRSEVASRRLPFRHEEELRDIPVLGTAMGADFEIGENGEMTFAEVTELFLNEEVDRVRRPRTLVGRKDVYALHIVGSSMEPRFEPGDPIYIDPRSTPRIGDDVAVYLRRPIGDDDEQVYSVLIKRLVRRTSTHIELRQFNPDLGFTVQTKAIARIERVIPFRELAAF